MWLPKNDLQDSSSWSSSPLPFLCDIHSNLLTHYVCKEGCVPSQSQVHVGARGGLSSQDDVSQQQQDGPHQILSTWQPFKTLKQTFAVSHRVEQLRLRAQQCGVTTVEDSVLHTVMENLESEEENVPRRVIYFKSMSWLGQIRPHCRDEVWSTSLWQTFFASCVGANIPALSELPLSSCGCRKFQIDTLGDHLCTCTAHSGAKKAQDWTVDQIADHFRTNPKVKTQQVARSRGQ